MQITLLPPPPTPPSSSWCPVSCLGWGHSGAPFSQNCLCCGAVLPGRTRWFWGPLCQTRASLPGQGLSSSPQHAGSSRPRAFFRLLWGLCLPGIRRSAVEVLLGLSRLPVPATRPRQPVSGFGVESSWAPAGAVRGVCPRGSGRLCGPWPVPGGAGWLLRGHPGHAPQPAVEIAPAAYGLLSRLPVWPGPGDRWRWHRVGAVSP